MRGVGAGPLVPSDVGFAVVLAAMARAVPPEKRSLAMGLGTAAGSAGQFLLVPVTHVFLHAHGWANAYPFLAVAAPLMIPPPGCPGAASPCPRTSCASRSAPRSAGAAAPRVRAAHVRLRRLVGLFNIAGCLWFGALGGRRSRRRLLAAIYASRAVMIALFVLTPLSTATVLVFAAVMGFTWLSTVPPTTGLVEQIFGPRYLATLGGLVFCTHQIGSFLGAWLGGVLYEHTDSYLLVWWTVSAPSVLSAVVQLRVDDRPQLRTGGLPAAPHLIDRAEG